MDHQHNILIVANDSSTDECEFVMEQKPQHSDTDSDVVFVSQSKSSDPEPLQLEAIARSKIRNRRGTPHPRCEYPTSSEDDEEGYRMLSSILDSIEKEEESTAAASNTVADSTNENNENLVESESNHNNAAKNNDNERPSTSNEHHSDNNDNRYNSVLRYRKRTNNECPNRAEAQKYKKDLFKSSSNDETDDEDADVDIEKRRKYECNSSEETTEPFLPHTDKTNVADSSCPKGEKRRVKKQKLSRSKRSEMMSRRLKKIKND